MDSPRNFAPDGRLRELDGLRGWAAVSVVLFHIFWETFGRIEPGFRNIWTGFFLHGRLAVCVFFVLSGAALSAGHFAEKNAISIVRLAVKRYFRLTIPILGSCVIVFILMVMGLTANHEAGAIVDRNDWLGAFLQFGASPDGMLGYALIDVYDLVDGRYAYNPFLWTMRIELIGSFIVFLILFVEPYLKNSIPTIAIAALVLFAAHSFIACFLAGILYAKLHQSGYFVRIRERRWPIAMSWICLPAIALTDGYIQIRHPVDDIVLPMAIAMMLPWFVFANKAIAGFFTSAPSRLLGRLSFPLYLVQFPVLVSLTSLLIVRADASGALTPPVIWAIVCSSMAACLIAAALFEPVERAGRILAETVSGALLKQRDHDPKERSLEPLT
jgi:peptidoglycan/LPS O-acetylase OafA/YrhL